MAHMEEDPLVGMLRRKLAESQTTKLARTDTPKASPLIERIQSPVRLNAPAAPPLSARDARSTGAPLDTVPASTVDDVDHLHFHRHEGTSEKVKPYFHNHLHDHVIRHDPADDGSGAHDERGHLNDPRHVAAMRGFGGWQAKSAGATIHDIIKAGQADSREVQGHVTNRNIALSSINERLASNAEALRHLSTSSAELAEVRKAAKPTLVKRARVVNRQAALTKKLDPILDLVKEREALKPYLDHPDFVIREGAKDLMAQKLAQIEKFGRADVQKAATVTVADFGAERIGRTVRKAVDQAMEDLAHRLSDLNRRSR